MTISTYSLSHKVILHTIAIITLCSKDMRKKFKPTEGNQMGVRIKVNCIIKKWI